MKDCETYLEGSHLIKQCPTDTTELCIKDDATPKDCGDGDAATYILPRLAAIVSAIFVTINM